MQFSMPLSSFSSSLLPIHSSIIPFIIMVLRKVSFSYIMQSCSTIELIDHIPQRISLPSRPFRHHLENIPKFFHYLRTGKYVRLLSSVWMYHINEELLRQKTRIEQLLKFVQGTKIRWLWTSKTAIGSAINVNFPSCLYTFPPLQHSVYIVSLFASITFHE